jgi:hypothetical protein
MRNRSTDLIEWNDALSEGMGCSGTRYRLSYDHPGDDCSLNGNARQQHWLITVDGFIICSAKSAQDALARSEGLEALRCILQGRCDRISDEHCRVAELIASEMLEATTEALSRSLRLEDRDDLLRNVDALQTLSSTIRLECLNRRRESKLDASPPLN